MAKYKTKPKLIFIVGIPRSGTSWILSKFEARTDCICITPNVLNVAFSKPTREGRLFFSGLTDTEIIKKVNKLLESGKHVIEKTPSNLENIDRIRRLFPSAKIVLVTRSCDEVLRSMMVWVEKLANLQTIANGGDREDVVFDFYERWWNHQAEYTEDDWDCIVRFEDMQIDEQAEAKRVFSVLGV